MDISSNEAMTRISEHFTLEELTFSQLAARLGLDNRPNAAELANLVRLAEVLEEVRALLDVPIWVTSGFRCGDLNRRVSGAKNSAHMDGRAADFVAPSFGTPLVIANMIVLHLPLLPFDQLIHEYGRWVHLGISIPGATPPRRQLLTVDRNGTHAGLLELS